jgi:hypothetical protein
VPSLPTTSIKAVVELVKALFHYDVKYGKAWKAKQAAFRMLYGYWEEAYSRIPRLLLQWLTQIWVRFMWWSLMARKQGFTTEELSKNLVVHFGLLSNA